MFADAAAASTAVAAPITARGAHATVRGRPDLVVRSRTTPEIVLPVGPVTTAAAGG